MVLCDKKYIYVGILVIWFLYTVAYRTLSYSKCILLFISIDHNNIKETAQHMVLECHNDLDLQVNFFNYTEL